MEKSLPANTVYEFVPEPNFAKAGTYKTRIRLLYPDNSMETSQEVTVSVYDHAWKAKKTVKKHKKAKKSKKSKKRVSDAKRYQAKVKGKSTAFGQAFKSKRLVTNRAKLPKKTSFRFARVPNFKRAVSYYTAVLVTYPDKSQEYTRQVKVTVKRQKDKARYQVKVRPGQVTLGQKLSPSQLVTNLSRLPKKSKFAFTAQPNWQKAGSYRTKIQVTYPDKSKETSAFLTVTVKDPADSSRYTPVLLAAKTEAGKAIAASSLIANFASLPAGSQASYLTAPDFAKAGSYKTQIKVTYPDKSTWTSSEFMIEVAPGAESTQSN
ncbi:Rib/alpha-like domain-containing protein [Lactobacillus delbrueckii]|uniref:Rib/alpha-like domain-containing protein n=1 Tax=Lactobacillus delbrueckii TaxID=1584 RepID=UPI0022E6904E|nr:Rib/alpha-like domain-containing protein [Lactobacillus delbrueckii]